MAVSTSSLSTPFLRRIGLPHQVSSPFRMEWCWSSQLNDYMCYATKRSNHLEDAGFLWAPSGTHSDLIPHCLVPVSELLHVSLIVFSQ